MFEITGQYKNGTFFTLFLCNENNVKEIVKQLKKDCSIRWVEYNEKNN